MGVLIRKAQELKYRLKLRKSLQEETVELLQITKSEVDRELNRRNKKK